MENNNQNKLESNNIETENLKNELTKARKIIEQQKLTINELQNKLNNSNNIINNLNNTINNYQNIINQKDIELNNFRAQLNNNIIKKNVDFDDIMCVNFISSDLYHLHLVLLHAGKYHLLILLLCQKI